jgi:hypothetical protein
MNIDGTFGGFVLHDTGLRALKEIYYSKTFLFEDTRVYNFKININWLRARAKPLSRFCGFTDSKAVDLFYPPDRCSPPPPTTVALNEKLRLQILV